MEIKLKDMNWMNIIIPSLLTGAIAGVGVFLDEFQISYEAALYSAGIAFIITVLQDLRSKLNKSTASGSKNKKKSKLRLLCFR